MEVIIETLTGTAFEMRVSPFETVISLKAKIQRLEGIPISQQHLIWQTTELQDDCCLHDYNIYDGATLRLVLAMRGGPINTRRVPVEDSVLQEMAEYVESNKEEIWEKLPNNRQVTILVFREGSHLNFFRFVDRGDGSLTPLSESYSGTSLVNDECIEEDMKKNVDSGCKSEIDKLKEQMRALKMETSVSEPPEEKRHTRSARQSIQSRLQYDRLLSSLYTRHNCNRTSCLPTFGQTYLGGNSAKIKRGSSSSEGEINFSDADVSPDNPTLLGKMSSNGISTPEPILCGSANSQDAVVGTLASTPPLVQSKPVLEHNVPDPDSIEDAENTPIIRSESKSSTRLLRSVSSSIKPCDCSTHLHSAVKSRKELTIDGLKDFLTSPTNAANGFKEVPCYRGHSTARARQFSGRNGRADYASLARRAAYKPDPTQSSSIPVTHNEHHSRNMSPTKSHYISGLFSGASVDRLGSTHIDSFLPPDRKSRYTVFGGPSMKGSSQSLEPRHNNDPPTSSYRLPPVKPQKKESKRCFLCAKKTGLATSYVCRCGNNFCAAHRYAEVHNCSFDYKTEGRKLLQHNNPVIAASKLPKI